jgi:hypothetical protein
MKTQIVFFLTLLAISFQGCDDTCTVENSYVYFEPVYSTAAELKASIGFKPAESLVSPGKIYVKDDILYVNETGKGIHLFDNSSPVNPKPLGFLNIPGNYDMAIIGNTLYADSFIDLVVFDISDVKKIKEINRIEALFNHNSSMGYFSNTSQGIVTSWKEVKNVTVTENDCNRQVQPWGGIYYGRGIAFQYADAASFKSNAAVAPSSSTGVAGSTSRFTITSNHLYTLDSYFLDVVDVTNPTQPVSKTEIQVSWMAETLFPLAETLFVGTRSGMYIFDLKNPDLPNQIGQYEHIYSCDPVVVEGDYAYVTLRNGNACQGTINQLEVIDIKNPALPSLVKAYPMTNPHGLGIDDGTLFICDGSDGLKIYDAKDVNTIDTKQLAHYKDINAFDIIPFKDIAIVIGTDGLYQYDYSNIKQIKLLSKITISNQ